MRKKIIILIITICFLLALSCCGHTAETMPSTSISSSGDANGISDDLYSISKAFLDVHYSVLANQAQMYDLLEGSLAEPDLDDYNKNQIEEQINELIKEKYQNQPLTEKGLESIETTKLCETLWKAAGDSISCDDIKITAVKTSPRNTNIDDKQNDIDYTGYLLIDNTTYKVTGTLVLTLIDGKWMIDDVVETGCTPALSY